MASASIDISDKKLGEGLYAGSRAGVIRTALQMGQPVQALDCSAWLHCKRTLDLDNKKVPLEQEDLKEAGD